MLTNSIYNRTLENKRNTNQIFFFSCEQNKNLILLFDFSFLFQQLPFFFSFNASRYLLVNKYPQKRGLLFLSSMSYLCLFFWTWTVVQRNSKCEYSFFLFFCVVSFLFFRVFNEQQKKRQVKQTQARRTKCA